MEFKLVPVREEQREILSNLLEKYDYEFSLYDKRDVNDLGLYGYIYLDYYWTQEGRYAYFIKVSGKLAGFVMVSDMPVVKERDADHQISEFFVMNKYRGMGLGKKTFFRILDTHRGKWQLKLHPENKTSLNFWENVINEYTFGKYEHVKGYPGIKYSDGTPADVYFFES